MNEREILIKIIEKVKEGYPTTGKNSALNHVEAGKKLHLVWLYNALKNHDDLSLEYEKARQENRKNRKQSDYQLSVEQKRQVLITMTKYVAQGNTLRGKNNALQFALAELKIENKIHWATIHVWFREYPDLIPAYHAAKEQRKTLNAIKRAPKKRKQALANKYLAQNADYVVKLPQGEL